MIYPEANPNPDSKISLSKDLPSFCSYSKQDFSLMKQNDLRNSHVQITEADDLRTYEDNLETATVSVRNIHDTDITK